LHKIIDPKVSVVIPTYNRAKDIPRCLDSLIAQTFKNFEVIICDDGSIDNTVEIVDSYMPYLDIIYSHDINFGGPARPRNRGIQLSRAPYIAFLDSDDWWHPLKLSESLEAAERENADVIYHDLYFARRPKQKFYFRREKSRAVKAPVYDDLLSYGNALQNSSVMVKKSVLEKAGNISEELDKISWEDFDCWLNISKFTERFYYLPKTLGFYWVGGGNITNPKRTRLNFEALSRYHISKHFNKPPFWFLYRYGKTLFSCGEYELSVKNLGEANSCKTSLFNQAKCRIAYFSASMTLTWKSLYK
jgi:glycosyltransferase involved in cell wall biosynthesis